MLSVKQKAGRLGAIRRNERYGNPGTAQGRRTGGLSSRGRLKKITIPLKTPELAEFIGIVLGDGSLTDYQVKIYFNARTDREYAAFVGDLAKKLFDLCSTVSLRPKNTLELVVSSTMLVDYLKKLGLQKGNKIAHTVGVPSWILEERDLVRACLRGLIDTDGGVYFHTHTTKGIRYRNMALCFTSRSRPLLDAVHSMFQEMMISAKNDLRERILVYNKRDIDLYMSSVGSHNAHVLERYRSYRGSKILA